VDIRAQSQAEIGTSVSPCSEDLLKKKVKDPSDFEWSKQCRFYWQGAY